MTDTMPSRPAPRSDADALPPPTARLVARALSLQYARARGDALPQLLRGRQLALMSSDAQGPAATLFVQAASELGANVSIVRPELDRHSSDADVAATARLLGRLYDAVECQGLADALVARLAQAAAIPVFAGLAGPAHPSVALVAQMPGEASVEDKRRLLIQAALAHSLE